MRKFALRKEYCSGDKEICSNYGGFPITEIRIIEINYKDSLRKIDCDFKYVPIRERFGLEKYVKM